jgi:hypothetical protein
MMHVVADGIVYAVYGRTILFTARHFESSRARMGIAASLGYS